MPAPIAQPRYAVPVRRVAAIALALLFAVATAMATAPGAAAAEDYAGLDEEIQTLKDEVVALNRDLFLLEEELLFPSSTQVAVFVSLDVGEFFALDAVRLSIDERVVAEYLYSEREVDALHRGGVHRLYTGNLKAGEHELLATFTGHGPHGREYRRASVQTMDKALGPKYIELRISDTAQALQPDFLVVEW